jgi:hypothetical protein
LPPSSMSLLWVPQINEIEVADLLPKRKPKFWA